MKDLLDQLYQHLRTQLRPFRARNEHPIAKRGRNGPHGE
jgi:hypothetical protein